jgi:glycosyltransferase involved in cell wall biosynthesis
MINPHSFSGRQKADMQQALLSRTPTYVIGCDVGRDIHVFSGITYHLAMQGIREGLLTGMMNLHPKGIGDWRIFVKAGLWKLRGGLHGRHGFKFTDEFTNAIWKRGLPALRDSVVINNFQLFGSNFLQSYEAFGIEPYYYIDGTLNEYFSSYRAFDAARIDEIAIHHALALEREGYARCRKVVVMSKRSAGDISRHYSVPDCKIRVVPPGANIPDTVLGPLDSRPEGPHRRDGKSLVVGFVGLYPERKGLPTVAHAVRLLRQTGYDVRLHVVGKCPPEIARQDGVTNFGLIDKAVDIDRFVEILGNIDIGCMLSRAELAGIALLEFLRMGVPVIATDVGGVPDILELGAGQLVSPEISAADLAQQLAHMVDEPDRITELRQCAWRRRHNASWRRAVHELKEVLNR